MLRISDYNSAPRRPSHQKSALARMTARYEAVLGDIDILRHLSHQIPQMEASTRCLSEQEVDALPSGDALGYQMKRIYDRFANYITCFPFSKEPECTPATYQRIHDNIGRLEKHFEREGGWKHLIERAQQIAVHAETSGDVPSDVTQHLAETLDTLDSDFQLFLNSGADFLRSRLQSPESHGARARARRGASSGHEARR